MFMANLSDTDGMSTLQDWSLPQLFLGWIEMIPGRRVNCGLDSPNHPSLSGRPSNTERHEYFAENMKTASLYGRRRHRTMVIVHNVIGRNMPKTVVAIKEVTAKYKIIDS
jgi:hypothetical protein